MNNNLRQQVLNSFKVLHRTRQRVFNGDFAALQKARQRINEEYKSKKNVSDTSAITELLKYSNEVENELRTTVVQAQEVAPGKYELRITKATVKMDNMPYKHCDSN